MSHQQQKKHWASVAEAGTSRGLWMMYRLYQFFGRKFFIFILYPVIGCFQITGTASKGAWRLSLNPIDSSVKQAINSISVAGGQYVNSVVIRERNGDQTQIQFNSARAITPNQAGF